MQDSVAEKAFVVQGAVEAVFAHDGLLRRVLKNLLVDDLLTLSQVCKRWRKIIGDTPELWKNETVQIDLFGQSKQADTVSRGRRLLQLAPCLDTLRVSCSEKLTELFKDVMKPLTHTMSVKRVEASVSGEALSVLLKWLAKTNKDALKHIRLSASGSAVDKSPTNTSLFWEFVDQCRVLETLCVSDNLFQGPSCSFGRSGKASLRSLKWTDDSFFPNLADASGTLASLLTAHAATLEEVWLPCWKTAADQRAAACAALRKCCRLRALRVPCDEGALVLKDVQPGLQELELHSVRSVNVAVVWEIAQALTVATTRNDLRSISFHDLEPEHSKILYAALRRHETVKTLRLIECWLPENNILRQFTSLQTLFVDGSAPTILKRIRRRALPNLREFIIKHITCLDSWNSFCKEDDLAKPLRSEFPGIQLKGFECTCYGEARYGSSDEYCYSS